MLGSDPGSVAERIMNQQYQNEINRRRTFGIISHPDAGKTTLTEKLLLFGGAIQQAGAVKARKAQDMPPATGWPSKRNGAYPSPHR